MTLAIRPFTHGLHEIGPRCHAWIQPDGGWGWSNACLVVDGEESLLVDTLSDLGLTRTMLAAMRDAEPLAARDIDRLVNTHGNPDHCNGNELVGGAEIIASRAAAEEMAARTLEQPAEPIKLFALMARIRRERAGAGRLPIDREPARPAQSAPQADHHSSR